MLITETELNQQATFHQVLASKYLETGRYGSRPSSISKESRELSKFLPKFVVNVAKKKVPMIFTKTPVESLVSIAIVKFVAANAIPPVAAEELILSESMIESVECHAISRTKSRSESSAENGVRIIHRN